ncbi:MAG: glycoside hydrolase family 43 protein [Acidobacteria bacterium]|nr:glycoside hydrolase family 43 protein [Acidobacteriota bacterium]
MILVRALLALILTASGLFAADGLLFSFFRNNGEDGLYLATSEDGLKWTELNGGKPLIKPEVGESKLMRDPSLVRGPDGAFHMVWTTAWEGRTIGHASSKDLIHWSAQQAIEVFPAGTEVHNCWAPEIYYDAPAKEFLIVWASTIKGRFSETLGTGNRDLNHRLYATRTRDFRAFTPTKLFYDPGFIVIDAAIFPERVAGSQRYAMVVKNETLKPEAKNLFLTYADSLNGPWTKPTGPISGKEWAEGPSPIRIGGDWVIYFDKYRNHRYGAVRSRDGETWSDITDQIVFPAGARHGTAFRAPQSVIEGLRRQP